MSQPIKNNPLLPPNKLLAFCEKFNLNKIDNNGKHI